MTSLELARASLLKSAIKNADRLIKCSQCQQEFPPSYYYPSVLAQASNKKVCKNCVKIKDSNYYKNNKEQIITNQKIYNAKPETKTRLKEYSQRPEVKVRAKHRAKLQKILYPVEYKARSLVTKALITGKLHKEPCEECGTFDNLNAHHDDYSKPLAVRWLCVTHHKEWHKNND